MFSTEILKAYGDFHTHTLFSHGKNSPEENVLAAIDKGLKSISISEHASANIFYGVRGKKLESLRKEIDRLKSIYSDKINIYMGYECNLTGDCRCDLEHNDFFDVVLLGYHKGIMPSTSFARSALAQMVTKKYDRRRNADALLNTASKYGINVLSHPNEYIRVDIPYLAENASKLGILLEINSSHLSMSDEEVKICYECGASFIMSSDAHRAENVGNFKNALDQIERTGVKDRVVNYNNKVKK